ncbi:MAG: MFS transporter [Stellaceae bacterium]
MGSFTKLAAGWCTLFVVGTDLFIVSPLLPMIGAEYKIPPALAGLGVTVFAVAYMVIAPILGHVADRRGRGRTLFWCLLGFGAANLLTACSQSFAWLLAARLLAGAAAAGISPAIYAVVGDAAPPERRATWMAIVVSGLLSALAVGAPIGTMVAATFGWSSVFVGLAGLSLVLAGANYGLWPGGQRAGGSSGLQLQALGARLLARRMSPTVVWSTALYGVYTYLGAGLAELGFSTAQIARTIVVYGGCALAGTLLGGRAADRFGAKKTAVACVAGLGVCFLLLRLALPSRYLVDAMLGLASLIAQMFFPAQQAGLAADFPARRATVLAWNNSALFVGISLGSLVGGAAIAVAGFAADVTVCAGIALAGGFVNWMAVPGPVRRRAEGTEHGG